MSNIPPPHDDTTTIPPMRLQRLGAERGVAWVREAWRVFASRPFAFASLLAALLMLALVLSVFGWVGSIAVTLALPLVSLVFMAATQSMVSGGVDHPWQAVAGLARIEARRARALLLLCLLYAIGMTVLFSVSVSIDQGSMQRLIELFAAPRTPTSIAEIDRLLASDSFQDGITVRLLGSVLLSIPFWHAPALVWWGRQSLWQALFSSTLGVWRSKGAYALYGLTLIACALGLTTVIGVALSIVDSPGSIRVAIAGLAMVLSVVFYVSLWFSFIDTFGLRRPAAPPRSDAET